MAAVAMLVPMSFGDAEENEPRPTRVAARINGQAKPLLQRVMARAANITPKPISAKMVPGMALARQRLELPACASRVAGVKSAAALATLDQTKYFSLKGVITSDQKADGNTETLY